MKTLKLVSIMALLIPLSSYAQEERPKHDPIKREAFKDCAEKNGLKKGEKPTDEQKELMKDCLKEKGVDLEKMKQFHRKHHKAGDEKI